MHRPTHKELKEFYDSALGALVYNRVKCVIRRLWEDVYDSENIDLTIVGVGFATQYLNPLVNKKLRIIAFSPKSQGAACWPKNHKNLAVIGRDAQLPFADNSIDKIIVSHCLEFARNPHETMQEIWRVLSPQGKVILIVPSRASIWSRSENTPFGYGRPFSLKQINRLLNDTGFVMSANKSTVFFPPYDNKVLLKAAQYVHKINKINFSSVLGGGIIITEAEKNISAPISGNLQRSSNKSTIYKPATGVAREGTK